LNYRAHATHSYHSATKKALQRQLYLLLLVSSQRPLLQKKASSTAPNRSVVYGSAEKQHVAFRLTSIACAKYADSELTAVRLEGAAVVLHRDFL
jgi:hypothetical protein